MVDSNRILQLLYGDSAQVDSAISDVVIVEGAVATDDAERIPGLVGQDGADVPASHHSICFRRSSLSRAECSIPAGHGSVTTCRKEPCRTAPIAREGQSL